MILGALWRYRLCALHLPLYTSVDRSVTNNALQTSQKDFSPKQFKKKIRSLLIGQKIETFRLDCDGLSARRSFQTKIVCFIY